MKVGFVFTNYNSAIHSIELLESLKEMLVHENFFIKVVIVENGSKQGEKNKLNDFVKGWLHADWVKVIDLNDNIGYFGGLNVGLRYIRKYFPEYEWLMVGSNDLLFPKTFMNDLSDSRDKIQSYPVVSPDIVTTDGVHQNPHVIEKISKFRELIYDLYYSNYLVGKLIKHIASLTKLFTDRKDEKYYMVDQEIYQGYGACYLLSPLYHRHFMDFPQDSFLMHEEYFLSKMLSDKGFKVFYEPSICVIHKHHGTVSEMPKKEYWKISREAHIKYRQYVKIFRKTK